MNINKLILKHVVRLFAVFAITLAACGCSDHPASRRADENAESLLQSINGIIFVSTEEFEVGLKPDGEEALGRWYLSFKGTAVTWEYSDFQQSGVFTMASDGTITATMGARQIRGAFDADSRSLLWDGNRYEAVVENDGA